MKKKFLLFLLTIAVLSFGINISLNNIYAVDKKLENSNALFQELPSNIGELFNLYEISDFEKKNEILISMDGDVSDKEIKNALSPKWQKSKKIGEFDSYYQNAIKN